MPVLVDTSVLLRLRDPLDPNHDACRSVMQPEAAVNHGLSLCAQVLIEYWVVATRPADRNGFGLSPAEVAQEINALRHFLPCLPEPADVLDRWFGLVSRHGVSGKASHDARLVAVMQAHGLTRLLTLNPADFRRYPGIDLLSPIQLVPTGQQES